MKRESLLIILRELFEVSLTIAPILQKADRSQQITDGAQLSWLVAGYSLTVGSFILISGRLGDMFGHKKLFVIGFAWFSLWSMIAGLAVYSNHVLFIFARVLQGIGPAITLPNGLALLGAAYAPGQRKNMVSKNITSISMTRSSLQCCYVTDMASNRSLLSSELRRREGRLLAAFLPHCSRSSGGHGHSGPSPLLWLSSRSRRWSSFQILRGTWSLHAGR